jgi:hypothetical protein
LIEASLTPGDKHDYLHYTDNCADEYQPEQQSNSDKMRDLAVFEIPFSIGVTLHANKCRGRTQQQLPETDPSVFVAIAGQIFHGVCPLAV